MEVKLGQVHQVHWWSKFPKRFQYLIHMTQNHFKVIPIYPDYRKISCQNKINHDTVTRSLKSKNHSQKSFSSLSGSVDLHFLQ